MNIIETKKAKIETKLKEAVEKNRKTIRESTKKFKKLTQKLIRQQRWQCTRGSSKSKTKFSDNSKRHQLRIQRQMVQDCEVSLAFLGLHNYVASKVEVFNENIQEFETINLVDEGEVNMSSDTETLTNKEIDDINLLLFTKERFNLSNDAYDELSMTCKELPRSWKVQERIRALNKKWNLTETPGNMVGVQQKIDERLKIRMEWLVKKSQPSTKIEKYE